MKKAHLFFALALLGGCSTVKYNSTEIFVENINYPELNTVVSANIGDQLLQKGNITKENVLEIYENVEGELYKIPANTYRQTGFDDNKEYYSAVGVYNNPAANPAHALTLEDKEDSELCVLNVGGWTYCYEAEFDRKTKLSERGNSFQQTLIYSGRIGDKINISYREFSNNHARPAFNNEVEYDIGTSNIIGYKGALLEVIKADNRLITYKAIKNFE